MTIGISYFTISSILNYCYIFQLILTKEIGRPNACDILGKKVNTMEVLPHDVHVGLDEFYLNVLSLGWAVTILSWLIAVSHDFNGSI